jgi:hypothetical protein
MKATIKSGQVEMKITGHCIQEMLSRFLCYSNMTAQPLGATIEIKIKTKPELKKHGLYGK